MPRSSAVLLLIIAHVGLVLGAEPTVLVDDGANVGKDTTWLTVGVGEHRWLRSAMTDEDVRRS